jgi:hypothetical protein
VSGLGLKILSDGIGTRDCERFLVVTTFFAAEIEDRSESRQFFSLFALKRGQHG